jgi:hypothetical protein
VRSWLLLPYTTGAAAIAAVFWLLSTVGFIAASLLFYSSSTSGELWRQLAIGASIVSTIGIALFSGIWPGAPNRSLSNLDTIIALAMNGVILVALLWLQWPPYTMFGK